MSALKNIAILSLLLSTSAHAAPENQLAAIKTMGHLNAIALQCGYIKQMQNIKRTLIKTLPAKRELGEWFEYTTNESYNLFMQKQSECPSLPNFNNTLQQSINTLEAVFNE